MVMTIEPFARCIEKLKSEREYDEIIFMSPDGETLNQQIANQLSIKKNVIILCGHYKGIDQRIRDIFVTREISIGDYVLSGGELPAAVLVDAVVIFEEDTPLELIKALMPDVLVKGGDYNVENIAGAKEVMDNGGEVIINPLVEGVSTTGILEKINEL